MTTALFRDDAYRQACEATVTAINERGGIVLDQTVFYAAGGGQPGDAGTMSFDGQTCPIATTVYDSDRSTIVHVPAEGATAPEPGAKVMLELNWDQRHKIAGAFYYGKQTWGGALRFRFESGFPYSPSFPEAAVVGSDVQPTFPTNSRRIPGAFEVDLNVYKQFEFGRFRPRVFAEVFNLLDTRNVRAVFSDTGEPDVTVTTFQTGSFDAGYFIRPDFYREPRRVQVGVEFNF